jgi:hypothetical protein
VASQVVTENEETEPAPLWPRSQDDLDIPSFLRRR